MDVIIDPQGEAETLGNRRNLSATDENSFWNELVREGYEPAFKNVPSASSNPTIADLIDLLNNDEMTGR